MPISRHPRVTSVLSFKLLLIDMLSVHPLGNGDGSYAIGELFLHFLCFPACPQLLRFSLSWCYLPSLSLHLLANRGGWWAGLPFGACTGHSGRTPMLLCLPGADGHLWLFNPFPSLTERVVCMTHKVIPTPVLTYLAVIQRGFTGSSPGNTVVFFFLSRARNCVPSFLPLEDFSLQLAIAFSRLGLLPRLTCVNRSSVPLLASRWLNTSNWNVLAGKSVYRKMNQ